MEEKNSKTVYVVQRIKNGSGLQPSENMEFEECAFCHEMIPIIRQECECGAKLVHACQSTAKKEVVIGKKTEFLELKKYATAQSGDGTITYYYECEGCKENVFMKLKIVK